MLITNLLLSIIIKVRSKFYINYKGSFIKSISNLGNYINSTTNLYFKNLIISIFKVYSLIVKYTLDVSIGVDFLTRKKINTKLRNKKNV